MGPSLYYVSKGTGWEGSEKCQSLLTFSTIYGDLGRVGQKSPKMFGRNIGMVHMYKLPQFMFFCQKIVNTTWKIFIKDSEF